jgi:hypothetical protein
MDAKSCKKLVAEGHATYNAFDTTNSAYIEIWTRS